MEDGISVTYRGLWGIRVTINTFCDRSATDWEFHLEDSTVSFRDNVFHFNATSKTACTFNLTDTDFPKIPRPSPGSDIHQTFSLSGAYSLQLSRLEAMNSTVLIGTEDIWHIANVHYSPVERIGCPSDADCGIYQNDQANVWKCIGQDLLNCFPIGDSAYGLEMSHLSQDDIISGIVAEYNGGVEGIVTIFEFQCSSYLPFGILEWGSVADQETNAIRFYIYTREVCQESDWGQINGGSIFILGLYWIILGYLGGGTFLNWIFMNKVQVPNEGFWGEVYMVLSIAIQWIVTGGHSSTLYTGLINDQENEESEHSPVEPIEPTEPGNVVEQTNEGAPVNDVEVTPDVNEV
jgi:hypothetical protein